MNRRRRSPMWFPFVHEDVHDIDAQPHGGRQRNLSGRVEPSKRPTHYESASVRPMRHEICDRSLTIRHREPMPLPYGPEALAETRFQFGYSNSSIHDLI